MRKTVGSTMLSLRVHKHGNPCPLLKSFKIYFPNILYFCVNVLHIFC